MSDGNSGSQGDAEMVSGAPSTICEQYQYHKCANKRLCTNKDGEQRVKQYAAGDTTSATQISMQSLQQYFLQSNVEMVGDTVMSGSKQ